MLIKNYFAPIMISAVLSALFGSTICFAQATEAVPPIEAPTDFDPPQAPQEVTPQLASEVDSASDIPASDLPAKSDQSVPVIDPFAATAVSSGKGGVAFTRQPTSNVPRLELRGIVWSQNNDRIGLLQVGNEGVYMVREGDTVSLRTGRGAGNTVLSIKEISKIAVLVETGVLGEVIIVR